MPWNPAQSKKFKKGMSEKQQRKWSDIANDALSRGASESSAIRQASGSVKQPGKMQAAAQRKLRKQMQIRRRG